MKYQGVWSFNYMDYHKDTQHVKKMDSDSADDRLINLVQKYKNIYDRSFPSFKDRTTRINTWKDISRELNSTDTVCEKRWYVLRTRYAMEKRKTRDDNKPSIWHLFNSMKFLDAYMTTRKSFGGYNSIIKNTPNNSQWDTDNAHQFLETKLEKEEEQIQYNERFDKSFPKEEEYQRSSTEMQYEEEDESMQGSHNETEVKDYKASNSKLQCNGESYSFGGVFNMAESTDLEYAFGKTVALMLKNMKSGKRRRKAQADIMQVLASYDSDGEETPSIAKQNGNANTNNVPLTNNTYNNFTPAPITHMHLNTNPSAIS